MQPLESAVTEFRGILADARERLALISEADATTPRIENKWSRKQILGHLIDSASNNHQRFVRAQLDPVLALPALVLPGYAQDSWVEVERFQDRGWLDLIELWTAYNHHLLHLMEVVPAGHLGASIQVGGGKPATLEFLMIDYVNHLKHHLSQILS